MCVALAPALAIAGTVISAGGQVISGIQQRNVARANARVAEQEAEQQRQVGRIQEMQTRERMRQQIARQRAGLAASGISLASGSALDLGQEAGEEAFLDAQAVRSQSDARVRGLTQEARLARASGRRALLTGIGRGFSTALSGGSRVAQMLA